MRIAFISLCLVALASAPASAQEQGQSSDILGQVYACASVSGEPERLACYDNAVGRLRQAQTSGNLVAVDRREAEDLDRDAFGFSLPSLSHLFGRGGEAGANARAAAQPPTFARTDELQLEIARVTMRRGGAASFTMTNGQVWSQIDDESPRNARAGGHVTIRRAAMGSYLMSVAAGGPALRVRRTQ